MSKRAAKTETESVPLMDELNELIEKERTLLNLKLLAQKNETEAWKTKYDKLVDKVGTGGAGGNGDEEASPDQQLEAAATIESLHVTPSVSYADIQQLLIERASSWVLDLKGTKMEKNDFAKIMKEVFSPRGPYPGINTADLSNCSLTDEFTIALLSFIRSSRLQAIDLSSNDLSEAFFLQLLTTLKDRRTTPQYLLLENNVPLSHSAKHFAAVLDSLTEHTWGLTVSLKDFPDIALSSTPAKSSRAARKELNYDYRETVKAPNLAFEFLRSFNAKLDPASTLPAGATATAAAIKKAVASSRTAVLLSRQSALHRMTVFGLKYCQLSKRSVTLLESTLLHTAPTLTDLDLSFAYMGYPGAEVLQRVLATPGCQIIRLGLVGNALGDAGVAAMGRSLQAHPTLTYLDLRSNAISNLGLNTLTEPLTHNHVLSVLDLRENDFAQDTMLALQTALKDVGSQLEVRCAQYSARVAGKISLAATVLPAPGSALVNAPHKVKVVGVAGKSTKLFSIDVATIYQNHPHMHGTPMVLQFKWRPVPIGTYDTTGAVITLPSVGPAEPDIAGASVAKSTRTRTKKGAAASEADENAAYFQIGSSYVAHWDVRVMQSHAELHRHREEVAPSSGVTRSVLQRSPEWITCSTLVQDVHAKSTIEVHVVCAESGVSDAAPAQSRASNAKKFIAFEGSALKLSAVPVQAFYPLGGDCPTTFSPENGHLVGKQNTSIPGLATLYPSMAGMEVLRRLRWTHDGCTAAKLSWSAKLHSTGGGDGQSTAGAARAAGSSDYPPNHHSLAYAWAVFVCAPEGGCRLAAEGICSSGAQESTAGAGAGAKLKAWMWHGCAAHIPGLSLDDTIFLAARALSEQPNYPAAILKKCAVGVRDVCLHMEDAHYKDANHSHAHEEEDEEGAAKVGRIGGEVVFDVEWASLYAVHDDANTYLPM